MVLAWVTNQALLSPGARAWHGDVSQKPGCCFAAGIFRLLEMFPCCDFLPAAAFAGLLREDAGLQLELGCTATEWEQKSSALPNLAFSSPSQSHAGTACREVPPTPWKCLWRGVLSV